MSFKDTAAYKIIRQITNHLHGDDIEYHEDDFILICGKLTNTGGSWEKILSGSMNDVKKLELVISEVVKNVK